MFAVVRSSGLVMTPSNSLKNVRRLAPTGLNGNLKRLTIQTPLFARHICHDPWGLLFALAFAAIAALFAYLLVHHFWIGQSQRAVLVATIYFGALVVIGALAKALLAKSRNDVNLRDSESSWAEPPSPTFSVRRMAQRRVELEGQSRRFCGNPITSTSGHFRPGYLSGATPDIRFDLH
jgi:hypothetical protein